MFEKLDAVLYVQVWENRLEVFHAQKNRSITEQSHDAFTTERMGIGQWAPAVKALKSAIQKICPKHILWVRPAVVMHQMIKNEGGLSEVEQWLLKELALSAGARKAVVWSGKPLSRDQILGKVYESAA